MGWHCITVWECQLKPKERDKTLQLLAYMLNYIYFQDRTIKPYNIEGNKMMMAAEDVAGYDKNE